MKYKLLPMVLILSFILCGCSIYSTPTSLIKPPKLSENIVKDTMNLSQEDIKLLAQKFIPDKAKMLDEAKSPNKKNVFSIDVDGDVIKEIVVFFKEDESFKKGFMVLKNMGDKWTKIYEKSIESSAITFLQCVSVSDKDDMRLIVGYLISGHAGSEYFLYNFKDKNVSEFSLGRWNSFEVLNTPEIDKEKGFVFATQIYQASSDYSSYVIRFDGRSFMPAEDFYNQYFRNTMIYYNDEIRKEKKNQLAWYYFIESQIKSGLYQEALSSISEVFSVKDQAGEKILEVGYYKFLILKAQALNGLSHHIEAESILTNLLKVSLNSKDDFFYYEPKEVSLSEIYYQLAIAYKGIGKMDEAKEFFKTSFNILQKLSEGRAYNEDYTLKIIKEVFLYPIIKEINN